MPVSLFSPAKINLGLSITGRRGDGYHLLESLFWPLSFGDSIEVSNSNSDLKAKWSMEAPLERKLPSTDDNIISKVLNSLVQDGYLSKKPGISLSKSIPMGGGLGGGSSNIGTIVKHLKDNRLFIKEPSLEWLSRFGADIPFFVEGKPSWVTGVGEVLRPLEVESNLSDRIYALLVVLPEGCETKTVFKYFHDGNIPFSQQKNPFPDGKITQPKLLDYLSGAQNDLEHPAAMLNPLIATTLSKLRSTAAFYASLSGSGSTCYALYHSDDDRKNSIKVLQSFFRDNSCKGITAQTYTAR